MLEFAFSLSKIIENPQNIKHNISFLSRYIHKSDSKTKERAVEIMQSLNSYKHSFDCYHLAFAENNCSKLYTFDKGFLKFREISKNHIEIL